MTLRFLSGLQEMKDLGWWRVSEKDGPNLSKPTRSSSFSLMHQKIRDLKKTFNIEKIKKNCCNFLIYHPVIVFKITQCLSFPSF